MRIEVGLGVADITRLYIQIQIYLDIEYLLVIETNQ